MQKFLVPSRNIELAYLNRLAFVYYNGRNRGVETLDAFVYAAETEALTVPASGKSDLIIPARKSGGIRRIPSE